MDYDDFKKHTIYYFSLSESSCERIKFYFFDDGSGRVTGKDGFLFEGGKEAWKGALRRLEQLGYHLIATGRHIPKPALDGLDRNNVCKVMEEWSKNFHGD